MSQQNLLKNKSGVVFTKCISIAFALILFSLTSIFSQVKEPVFNDDVFLVDQVIKLGEEDFLTRIGLQKNENAETSGLQYVPIDENQSELPVGLVLSGGAARAFAHIGVLKKLEEEGIYPDFLVANSMGSLVALLYAAGLSPDQIEKVVSDYSMDFLFTARFPLDGGIIDDYNMMSAIYNILGETDIKDLQIPIIVLAEDLVSRRTVAFMEGDFYKVLSATIAMPVSFPPVRYNDMILLDGGATNLVPVQAAADYTNRIITSTSFSDSVSEYRDILSVINRALDLGKTRKGIIELKTIDNILIRCNVEDISYMAFDKSHEIADRGEGSAALAIDEIKKAGFDKTTTWSNERIASLEDTREQLLSKHEKTLLSYKKTNMIYQKEFAGYVSGGYQMYSGNDDDYYLDNSDYFYLSQRAEVGSMFGELREYWDPWRGLGVDGRLNISLFDAVLFQNRVSFKWDTLFDEGFTNGFEGIYYYGKINAKLTNDGNKGIDPYIAWEGFFPNIGGLSTNTHSSFGRLGANFYLSNFSVSPYAFIEDTMVTGFGVKNDFKIPIFDFLSINQKTVSRFPFDFSNTISLYQNDGLRGATTSGSYNYFIVTNNNLTFEIDTVGTLFEVLVIKDLGLSAFCDYYKTDVHGFSAGAEVDVTLAVLGLVSMQFSGYGGYDVTKKSGFLGFSISGNL